jgi:hypothetical protein
MSSASVAANDCGSAVLGAVRWNARDCAMFGVAKFGGVVAVDGKVVKDG